MKKERILKIVFLGKKPFYFDEFLISLNEKIKEGNFFNNRFEDIDSIRHVFLPKSKDFDFIALDKIFSDHRKSVQLKKEQLQQDMENELIPYEKLVDIEEKMIVVHFGKVPNELLSMIHTEQSIELNFYSISSNRIKGRKSHQKSGRRVFYFKDKKCKRIFIQNSELV